MSGVRVPAPPPDPAFPTRLRRIEPVLRRSLRGPCRLPAGSRVLVAVSGGADSTALLLGLHRLSAELGVVVHAAHLHHGLRGKEADRDLAFVRSLCGRLGVPLLHARWDTRARMRRRGLSGQAGLRQLRREFLLAAARRTGAAAIATGHTADDQLETLLLRLGRGTGLPGFGAIAARRGRWIRPLLRASREQIESDLRAGGQGWREDHSNSDPRYARNRIRHRAIPALLEALDGREEKASARGALALKVAAALAEVRAASRLVERHAVRVLERARIVRDSGGHWSRSAILTLDARVLRSCHPVVRRMALRLAWRGLRKRSSLTERHLQALFHLVKADRVARADLPEAMVATARRGVMSIGPAAAGIEGSSPTHPVGRFILRVPGQNLCATRDFRACWLEGRAARTRLRDKPDQDEYFASEALQGEVEVRQGHTDEWFVPFGRHRGLPLGEFLSKQQVPDNLRVRPMVLADSGGILWVVGVRRSARAPLTRETRKALWIHTEPR